MKKKIVLTLISVLISFSPVICSENIFYNEKNLQIFNDFFIQNLPGIYFPVFFLENFSPDSVITVEENNGFSLFDNPRVYFEGNSVLDFNWEYNGFRINSAINNGRSALIIPFSSIASYEIGGDSSTTFGNGININSDSKEGTYVFLSNVFGDMGSYTSLGPVLIQPEHPRDRDEMLSYTRRKLKNSYFADISTSKRFGKNIFSLSISHTFMKRQFNDFRKKDTVFNENLNGLFIAADIKRSLTKGTLSLYTVLNKSKRDNLFAELGRLPDETYRKDNTTVFIGLRLEKPGLNADISFVCETENIDPVSFNFTKDLLDNDGGGLYPYERFGNLNSKIFSGKFKKNLINNRKSRLRMFGDFRYSGLFGNESVFDNNAVLFDGSPYRVIKWDKPSSYSNFNLKIRSGFLFKTSLSKKTDLYAKFFIDYSKIVFKDGINNFEGFIPGVDIGFLYNFTERSKLSLHLGSYPVELKENINFFLEKSGMSGTVYDWQDINSDNLYLSGEEGRVVGYTGGKYHFIDNNLKRPFYNRLLIIFNTRVSGKLYFNVKGVFKKFFNPLTVSFKDNDEYGFFESDGDNNFFFFNKPFEKFYLTNGIYDKNPFYAELLLNLSGSVREKWFFSFSFMAHMGMGYTAFGNGPAANDIGILNESSADPNSRINGFGRVDGDRGYVSKLFFGLHIFDNLFFSTSIKYRDGDPFAFLNTYYKYNQRIIYYSTIQAEDERGVKGGPREDYIADLSFKLSYRFKLFKKRSEISLSFFNVIDIGGELSEYVFSGGERYATEMQLPKSLRINLKIGI